MRKIPQQGDIYRDFKGDIYQITAIASDCETFEDVVVHQALFGEYKYYVIKMKDFLSEVDRTKYPDSVQNYYFEYVSRDNVLENNITDNIIFKEESEFLELFFDAKSSEKKIEILKKMRENNILTERMLEVAAASVDCVLMYDSFEDKYESLIRFLTTKAKYEFVRLR